MFPVIRPGDERKSFPVAGTKATPAPLTKMKALSRFNRFCIHLPARIIISPFRVGLSSVSLRHARRKKIRVLSWGCQSWSKPVRTV